MMIKHAEAAFIPSDDDSAFAGHEHVLWIKVSEKVVLYTFFFLRGGEDQEAGESVAGAALARHDAVVPRCLQRNRVAHLQLQEG